MTPILRGFFRLKSCGFVDRFSGLGIREVTRDSHQGVLDPLRLLKKLPVWLQ
jgi:hypothetical protein